MKNYVQSGEILPLIAPSGGVVGGKGYLIGAIFVVAGQTAAAAAAFSGYTRGVFDLDKVAATAITTGTVVYWDATNRVVTTTSSGNTKIGACVADAASADATIRVRLNGIV